MGLAENRQKAQAFAQWMKDHGVRRTTGTCPICYRTISIPTDRHFYGAVCQPRRKGSSS